MWKWRPTGDTLTIEADYCRPGIFSLVGSLRFRDFGLGVVEILLSGRPLAVADTACFGGLSASERAAYQGIGVAAYVAAPIIKDGRTRALLSVHQSVARSWTPPEVLLAQDVADRTWEAVERARAETALRDSEGQLRALVAELQDRTHNLLGVVSSIASRTFRAHSDPAECKVAFKESLKALSNAQRLLSHLQEGQRVTLDELLRAEFTSLAVANEGRRITLVGPPGIRLRSSGLQTLALALHELAVNSSRYGALQARTGKLEVRWRLARNGDGKSWLEIDWRESGVSIVGSRAPNRQGTWPRTHRKSLALSTRGQDVAGVHRRWRPLRHRASGFGNQPAPAVARTFRGARAAVEPGFQPDLALLPAARLKRCKSARLRKHNCASTAPTSLAIELDVRNIKIRSKVLPESFSTIYR